jgi:Family of unknown function (DUF6492)
MGQTPMMPSLAFVTPSYPPDLERCALLVESLDRFGPEFKHYVIVDRADMPSFAYLASHRTILIEAETIIDRRFIRIPWKGSSWYNWRVLPMRGWISQQVYKLAAVNVVPEDILVMTDSDTTFVRAFTVEDFLIDGKTGLLDVDYCAGMVPAWTGVATKLLKLQQPPELRGHVGNLIAWRRDHIAALHAHIEAATGLPWQIAIARHRTFSEYVLYGVFLRDVIGYDNSFHAPSTRSLVKQPWDHDLSTQAGMKSYFDDIEPDNIAVMIHSKGGLPVSAARPYFEALFAAAR